MTTPDVTDEQIAAAQLRLVLDQKLGRPTPEVVRRIAAMPRASKPVIEDAAPPDDPPRGNEPRSLLVGPRQPDDDTPLRSGSSVGIGDVVAGTVAGDMLTGGLIGMPSEPVAFFARPLEGKPRLEANEVEIGALTRLGQLLVAQARYDEAEDALRNAVDRAQATDEHKALPYALESLAELLARQGRLEEAEYVWRKVVTVARSARTPHEEPSQQE